MAETIKNQNPTPEFSRTVKVSRLTNNSSYVFDETPSEDETNAMADLFDVVAIRKMRFGGSIVAFEDKGWLLEGVLGATVSQNCVITLERVRTRIDLDIRRVFVPLPEPTADEVNHDASDDDELEPLGKEIDFGLIAMEALALAIPEYPRIEGAELPDSNFSPSGSTDITDEAPKAFAGLAALKEKLSNPDE